MLTYSPNEQLTAPDAALSLEAEQSILMALFHRKDAYDRVADILKPEYFYDGEHRKIYVAIAHLCENNKPVDVFSVKAQVKNCDDKLWVYIQRLIDVGIPALDIRPYAEMLLQFYRRRSVMEACTAMYARANEGDSEQDVISEANVVFDNLLKQEAEDEDVKHVGDSIVDYVNSLGKPRDHSKSIQTGIPSLDEIIGYINGGNLCVIAGRTGHGKTALALSIQDYNIKQGKNVLYYSMEMSVTELQQRMIAMQTGISVQRQQKENFSSNDFGKMLAAAERLKQHGAWVNDSGAISLAKIKRQGRYHKRKNRLDCIVVDYLGLMAKDKAENVTTAIEAITGGLKALAAEYDIPIILLAQLNRAHASRTDYSPQLSDLRSSGSIEQDANQVIFVYREWQDHKGAYRDMLPKETNEDYYKYKLAVNDSKNTAKIIVAKNRNGSVGEITVNFDGAKSLFFEGAI